VPPILAPNIWAGCHPCHAFTVKCRAELRSKQQQYCCFTLSQKYEAQTLFAGYFCYVRTFVSILVIADPPIKWVITAKCIVHCVEEVNMKWAMQLKETV